MPISGAVIPFDLKYAADSRILFIIRVQMRRRR
jgi:hypothetical protein